MEDMLIKINDRVCSLKDLASVMGVQGVIEVLKIFQPDGKGFQTWEISADGTIIYTQAG